MTLGISGEKCQADLCMQEAEYCAALTANSGEVCSHRFLCETHAQAMFAIVVNFGERLTRKVQAVKREQERENDHS